MTGQSRQGTVPPRPDDATNGPVTRAQGEDDRIAAAEARADEHLKDLQRLAAEFDNYRKRVLRDQL